jgi:hypothetical protein
MSLAYLQILQQLSEDWCFLVVSFHNRFWMCEDSCVLMVYWALYGQATNEGRDYDETSEGRTRRCHGYATLGTVDVCIVMGRITDMMVKLFNPYPANVEKIVS